MIVVSDASPITNLASIGQKELGAELLLIDEHIGRLVAVRLGVRIIGLLGVLIEARDRGLLREIKPLVDALMGHGFRIGKDLYHRVKQTAGSKEVDDNVFTNNPLTLWLRRLN